MQKINDIRNYFVEELIFEKFVEDKTGVKTIEMIGAQFLADESTIFGSLNESYIAREIKWYNSKSLNVNDIDKPIPKIWKEVADKNGNINSNYGWCIYSYSNYYQYENCYDELKNNPNSRRAIMIYTRPSMQYAYRANGMSDFMCTNTVQYLIRDGALISIVNMRSNDVVFGYRNDRAWQYYVQSTLAAQLNVEVGDLIWNVGSLHVYERHFDMVK
jgi:thymidylate synthase